MKPFHLAVVMLAFVIAPATAQTADATPQYKACLLNGDSMMERRKCASDELQRQKALLNTEYKITAARASVADRTGLEKAQKAWLDFRNLDCDTKAASVHGTGSADMYFECMLLHIQLRRAQLESYWLL